jgi:hypothetical protein
MWICRLRLTALAAGVLSASITLASEGEEGFVSMFNGKDLTGWEGKPGGWWVEDGAITSQSTEENPCVKHHYLYWRGGRPADFELRLEYRIVGGNSGIQFRSREVPEWDTDGYQADIEAGQQWTGALFQHRRGGVAMRGEKVVIDEDGKKTVTPIGDPVELQKHVHADDWNRYYIVAKGPEVILKINDVVMSHAIDRDRKLACRQGVIALQMHPGPPMKVQFRNLRIKILKSESP